MRAINNTIRIWNLAGGAIGPRSRLLAFLCARLGSLAEKRRTLRSVIIKFIGFFARNGQVSIHLRISGQPITVFLRKGNKADYLVLGEIIGQSYELPSGFAQTPTSVVDGGANIGLFALAAYARFPGIELTCYEPEPDNVRQLQRNLEANKIKAQVIPKALWSETADLYFHPGESYSGFVNTDPSPHPISCVLPVVPDDCWLKLDIEGAEYEVLPALLNIGRRPGIISMEIHDFDRRGNTLLSLLRTHGYQWNESLEPTAICVNICALRGNV